MKKMQCILMVLVLMVALCAAASASRDLFTGTPIRYDLTKPVSAAALPHAQTALAALILSSVPMLPFRDIFRPPISPHRRTRKPLFDMVTRARSSPRRVATLCCVN